VRGRRLDRLTNQPHLPFVFHRTCGTCIYYNTFPKYASTFFIFFNLFFADLSPDNAGIPFAENACPHPL
jgi:hypothetical protein